jgi:nitrogen regulatory protein P-II 1
MKKIEGIVRPHLVRAVKAALREVGVHGITVSAVRGRARFRRTPSRGAGRYETEFTPSAKIEAVLAPERLDAAVAAIVRTARTGKRGDGNVFVSDLDDAISIGAGGRREEAVE